MRKKGIRINGSDYIIKFRKNTKDGKMHNHVSEYLGSCIFGLLGCVVQDTWLGMYRGEEIVLMKDFVAEGEVFIPFCDVREQMTDAGEKRHLAACETERDFFRSLGGAEHRREMRDTFWDVFVIDALLGNPDRRENSWGFVKTKEGYELAPVFNNDACLFPGIVSDDQCREVLASGEKMEQLIFEPCAAQIRMDRRECSFLEIISSHRFRECDKALWRIISKMDFAMLDLLVQAVDILSDIKKQFILTMIEERYKRLLLEPFERTM